MIGSIPNVRNMSAIMLLACSNGEKRRILIADIEPIEIGTAPVEFWLKSAR